MKKITLDTIRKTLLYTALVYLSTMTGAFLKLPGGAYLHIGDSMIYLAALALPLPCGLAASAAGAAFADITLGSFTYIIPTIIIKSLMFLAAKNLMKLSEKPLMQDVLVCLSGTVTIVGYYITDAMILKSFTLAFIDSAGFNLLQALASAAVYLALAGFLRRK